MYTSKKEKVKMLVHIVEISFAGLADLNRNLNQLIFYKNQ